MNDLDVSTGRDDQPVIAGNEAYCAMRDSNSRNMAFEFSRHNQVHPWSRSERKNQTISCLSIINEILELILYI